MHISSCLTTSIITKHITVFAAAQNYTDISFQVKELGDIKAVLLPDTRTVAQKPTRGCTLVYSTPWTQILPPDIVTVW